MKKKICEALACGMPVLFSYVMVLWWLAVGYI